MRHKKVKNVITIFLKGCNRKINCNKIMFHIILITIRLLLIFLEMYISLIFCTILPKYYRYFKIYKHLSLE